MVPQCALRWVALAPLHRYMGSTRNRTMETILLTRSHMWSDAGPRHESSLRERRGQSILRWAGTRVNAFAVLARDSGTGVDSAAFSRSHVPDPNSRSRPC